MISLHTSLLMKATCDCFYRSSKRGCWWPGSPDGNKSEANFPFLTLPSLLVSLNLQAPVHLCNVCVLETEKTCVWLEVHRLCKECQCHQDPCLPLEEAGGWGLWGKGGNSASCLDVWLSFCPLLASLLFASTPRLAAFSPDQQTLPHYLYTLLTLAE